MDEITGTLQNFDGTNMTISSDDDYDDDYTSIVRSYGVSFVIDGKAYLTFPGQDWNVNTVLYSATRSA